MEKILLKNVREKLDVIFRKIEKTFVNFNEILKMSEEITNKN